MSAQRAPVLMVPVLATPALARGAAHSQAVGQDLPASVPALWKAPAIVLMAELPVAVLETALRVPIVPLVRYVLTRHAAARTFVWVLCFAGEVARRLLRLCS